MSTVNSIVHQLNEILDSANNKMESSHTNVTDAVRALVEGYGKGSGESVELSSITITPTGDTITETADEGHGWDEIIVDGDKNLIPANIAAGITIYGVTGALAPITVPKEFTSRDPDLPDPGTVEDADMVYIDTFGTPHLGGKLLLVDVNGNITYGYLDDPIANVVQYGSVNLPDIQRFWDEESATGAGYKNAHIFYSSKDKCYYLICSVEQAQWLENGSITAYDDTGQFFYVALYKLSFSAETPEWTYDRRGGMLSSETWTQRWGTLIWSSYNIYSVNGTLYHATTEPVRYPIGGFTITSFDPVTTEFKAVGWRRLSYHTTGELEGTWTYDDFTTEASTGWNYLKNVRWCSNDKLLYRYLPIWATKAVQNSSLPSNMNQWTKNVPAQGAFTSIIYNDAEDENTCSYTGVGMFEYIGSIVSLTAGKTYRLVIDYYCPVAITGEYEAPYSPYFGFSPVGVLSSDAHAYASMYSVRHLPTTAMDGYQTFACTYTPSANVNIAISLGFGSTLDGVAIEFKLKNIGLWEMPDTQYTMLADATDLFVIGETNVVGTDGYILNTTTNRLRVGATECNTITATAGNTLTVGLTSVKPSNWAMWFINSSGIEKIAASSNLVAGTDYIDTGWMENGDTYVVPDDTQYIWFNFRNRDDSDVTLDELQSYVIYRVVDYKK